jgi:NUMOD3 motif
MPTMTHPLAGRKQSPEHVEKRAAANRGRKHSEEAKARIRAGKARNPGSGHTGKHHSAEAREKLRVARKLSGIEHPLWKGEKVSYTNLHRWVQRHKPRTGTCARCQSSAKRTQWANVDHLYRRVLEDYIEMCVSCHKLYDLAMTKATP